uniref:Uncharacterized protein n=1 Tax=Anguilla anguilla TaxID=7936 RepID=A0A0E9TH22_ANGAN
MQSPDTVPSGDSLSKPLSDRNSPLSWITTPVCSVYCCFALGSRRIPKSNALDPYLRLYWPSRVLNKEGG